MEQKKQDQNLDSKLDIVPVPYPNVMRNLAADSEHNILQVRANDSFAASPRFQWIASLDAKRIARVIFGTGKTPGEALTALDRMLRKPLM